MTNSFYIASKEASWTAILQSRVEASVETLFLWVSVIDFRYFEEHKKLSILIMTSFLYLYITQSLSLSLCRYMVVYTYSSVCTWSDHIFCCSYTHTCLPRTCVIIQIWDRRTSEGFPFKLAKNSLTLHFRC